MTPRRSLSLETTTTTMDLDDLEALAAKVGATVGTHYGGEKGRRYPNGMITLRADLGFINRRCTLAHELAHHIAGDTPSPDPWVTARQERRAWELAAQWLISPVEYLAAERLHAGSISGIAHELGVTTHLITMWQDHYLRKEAL